MKDLKVLVAEDDKLNRMMICRLLEKYGVKCTTAENGKVALDKCFAGDFDIVMLDYNMPGYSGYECAERIRKKYNGNSHRPLIVGISADDEHEDDKVFDAFLAKPFKTGKIEELLAGFDKGGNNIRKYNIEEVASTIGLDKDTMLMLLDEFISVMDEEAVNLRDSVEEDDHEKITHYAHKIKGAAANMMAEDIRSYTSELQKADKTDRVLVETLLNNILRSIDEFKAQF